MLKIVVSPGTDGHTATKSDPYEGGRGKREERVFREMSLLCKNL